MRGWVVVGAMEVCRQAMSAGESPGPVYKYPLMGDADQRAVDARDLEKASFYNGLNSRASRPS